LHKRPSHDSAEEVCVSDFTSIHAIKWFLSLA
jgi:hypothetical protein